MTKPLREYGRDKKKVKRKKPKLNQFGGRMARAIPTLVQAWVCSECQAVSFGTKGKAPIRCSNRRSCGKLFHGVTTHSTPIKERQGGIDTWSSSEET